MNSFPRNGQSKFLDRSWILLLYKLTRANLVSKVKEFVVYKLQCCHFFIVSKIACFIAAAVNCVILCHGTFQGNLAHLQAMTHELTHNMINSKTSSFYVWSPYFKDCR